MSPQDPTPPGTRPPAPRPLDAEERALAERLSRLGPHGEPSPALDSRILSAAHAAVSAKTSPSAPGFAPRLRWPVGVGIAASLALAIGLAWQLRPLPDAAPAYRSEADSALRSISPPAAVMQGDTQAIAKPEVAAPAMVLEVPPPEPSRAKSAPPQAFPAQGDQASEQAVPLLSPGQAAAAPAEARRMEPPVVFDAPLPAPPPAPPAPPAPSKPDALKPQADVAAAAERKQAARTANQDTAKAADSGSRITADKAAADKTAAATQRQAQPEAATAATRKAVSGNSFDDVDNGSDETSAEDMLTDDMPNEDVPPATVASPVVRDAWLTRIRELLHQGRTEEARASLREFRLRYPNYRLPDDLRTLPAPAAAPTPAPAGPAADDTPAP